MQILTWKSKFSNQTPNEQKTYFYMQLIDRTTAQNSVFQVVNDELTNINFLELLEAFLSSSFDSFF